MNYRKLLQSLYYLVFKEHLFTTLNKINKTLGKIIIKLNYGKRIWEEYQIIESKTAKSLLLIHIPKCGGTSIANALINSNQNKNNPKNPLYKKFIRHLPASILKISNPNKFQNIDSFAIVREPSERLASLILHFNKSAFSTYEDKDAYNRCAIDEDNLDEAVLRLLKEKDFSSKLFTNSNPGRAGFSVSQADYLCFHNELLVENLFDLSNMLEVESWLESKLGVKINIPHKNVTNSLSKFASSDQFQVISRKYLSLDYAIYDAVKSSNGSILSNTRELAKLKKHIKSLRT